MCVHCENTPEGWKYHASAVQENAWAATCPVRQSARAAQGATRQRPGQRPQAAKEPSINVTNEPVPVLAHFYWHLSVFPGGCVGHYRLGPQLLHWLAHCVVVGGRGGSDTQSLRGVGTNRCRRGRSPAFSCVWFRQVGGSTAGTAIKSVLDTSSRVLVREMLRWVTS